MANRRVYIAVDNAAIRDSLSVLLKSDSYAVRGFGSATEFLAAAASLRAGCLIVDLRMPEMDGLELQRRLVERALPFPMIVITGHGDVPLAVRAMKAGAVDFIEKPFAAEAILDSLGVACSDLAPPNYQDPMTAAAVAKLALLSPRAGSVGGAPRRTAKQDDRLRSGDQPAHRRDPSRPSMDKMGARSLSELVRLALAAGLRPSPQ